MILVDAKLLVYAVYDRIDQHRAAREWLDEDLNGTTRVGLAWDSLLAFVRLLSNPRIFSPPLPMARAWRQVEEWLDLDNVWIPTPTHQHRAVMGALISQTNGKAKWVPDAHLAALAIEHGLTLCSADRDFARFSNLKWENPIA